MVENSSILFHIVLRLVRYIGIMILVFRKKTPYHIVLFSLSLLDFFNLFPFSIPIVKIKRQKDFLCFRQKWLGTREAVLLLIFMGDSFPHSVFICFWKALFSYYISSQLEWGLCFIFLVVMLVPMLCGGKWYFFLGNFINTAWIWGNKTFWDEQTKDHFQSAMPGFSF